MERTRPPRALPRDSNGDPDEEEVVLTPPDQAFRILYDQVSQEPAAEPLDTETGRLQNNDHPALPVLERFLSGLQNNRLNPQTIPDSAQFSLEISLEPLVDSQSIKIARYRVGEIRVSEENAQASIRLFTRDTSAIGEVFLQQQEGDWLITDIDFPWEQLTTPSDPPRFTPSTHQWTVGSHL
ncbi:MAG: hypothetical protein ACOCVC_08055 [Spirochaeta sp.]